MVCRNFILPEICKPCLFYLLSNLRNLLYLITEKDQLTEKICAVRKELRTAQKIPPRADRMRERIELLNTQEQQHAACREER